MARRRKPTTPDLVKALRRSRAPWWVILVVVLAVVAAQFFASGNAPDGEAGPVDAGDAGRTYLVERVIDGDTLVLAGGDRVRLLGVDTPETVAPGRPVEPFGPEASRFTKDRVEGKSVRLGFDKERRDRYGRLLAYVYVDGVLLNEELIRAGLSKAQLRYPYSNAMKRVFRDAEAEAKAANRGVWSLPAKEESPSGRRRAA
ncbi:MAG TPA: thermonuclease family protein [Planctomycetaceae bacterium]